MSKGENYKSGHNVRNCLNCRKSCYRLSMLLSNHWEAGCCKLAIKHLEEAPPSLDDGYECDTDRWYGSYRWNGDKWIVKVKIPSQDVQFRVDTWATYLSWTAMVSWKTQSTSYAFQSQVSTNGHRWSSQLNSRVWNCEYIMRMCSTYNY